MFGITFHDLSKVFFSQIFWIYPKLSLFSRTSRNIVRTYLKRGELINLLSKGQFGDVANSSEPPRYHPLPLALSKMRHG